MSLNSGAETQQYSTTFLWTIDGFSCVTNRVTSSIFKLHTNRQTTKWYLSIGPFGINEYVSINLTLHTCETPYIRTNATFSILDQHGEKVLGYENLIKEYSFYEGFSFYLYQFVEWNYLAFESDNLLPGDKFSIYLELTISDIKPVVLENPFFVNHNTPETQLSIDMDKLFVEKQFCDIILTINGREIHAHKMILAARSKVFEEMLEQNPDRIVFTDFEYPIIFEIVKYIYTGQAPSCDDICMNLFRAAKKYGLERLQSMCEEEFATYTTIRNAATQLILAKHYDAKLVEERVTKFILSTNLTEIMKTSTWKDMTETHPHIIASLYSTLAQQKVLPIAAP